MHSAFSISENGAGLCVRLLSFFEAGGLQQFLCRSAEFRARVHVYEAGRKAKRNKTIQNMEDV